MVAIPLLLELALVMLLMLAPIPVPADIVGDDDLLIGPVTGLVDGAVGRVVIAGWDQ
jgi:hypothetical protein